MTRTHTDSHAEASANRAGIFSAVVGAAIVGMIASSALAGDSSLFTRGAVALGIAVLLVAFVEVANRVWR